MERQVHAGGTGDGVHEHLLRITVSRALHGACRAGVAVGGGDVAAERDITVEPDKVVARVNRPLDCTPFPHTSVPSAFTWARSSRPISSASLASSRSAFRLSTFVWESTFRGARISP